jgi:endonuclease/exonuclease/phosphatase family metal-dependent hydrolase
VQLVNEIAKWLSEHYTDTYKVDTSEMATGAQGLKVATIYNSTKLALHGTLKHLIIDKGGKKAQYGIVQHFKRNDSDKEFLNINVHLNGGKTEKDQKVRLDQLKNLVAEMQLEPFSHITNRVISGDFNTDISEVEEILKDQLQMTYAF